MKCILEVLTLGYFIKHMAEIFCDAFELNMELGVTKSGSKFQRIYAVAVDNGVDVNVPDKSICSEGLFLFLRS